VSELLHESGLSGSYGGLKFDVPAFAPALSAVHLVSDEAAGFGATLKMFAHDPATTVQERMGPNAKQWDDASTHDFCAQYDSQKPERQHHTELAGRFGERPSGATRAESRALRDAED
jgi:hypothetical protein